MKITFTIAFAAAIALGFFLVNPWAFLYYLLLLFSITIVVICVVVISLLDKSKVWKIALLWLAVGYTAALSSYCISSYLSSRISQMSDKFIIALYNYRSRHHSFPHNPEELSFDLSKFRGRYVPDSSLNNFELYTKDLYGMPRVFSSKDSSWRR